MDFICSRLAPLRRCSAWVEGGELTKKSAASLRRRRGKQARADVRSASSSDELGLLIPPTHEPTRRGAARAPGVLGPSVTSCWLVRADRAENERPPMVAVVGRKCVGVVVVVVAVQQEAIFSEKV
jgi:hypothetical protein